ncbi:hypothetical protein [Candidatus Leptofilum sp.]|uniref:hypothetical protein n=1 Tax=Candidatus Leptofilum sp. TaxID=3241576 RepID=UPI003B5BD5D0
MKNRRVRKIIIGVAVFFSLCCVGFIAIALLLPDPEPGEATAVSVEERSELAEIVDDDPVEEDVLEEENETENNLVAEEPVETSAPSTNTPEPTVTSTPEPTVTNPPKATETQVVTETPVPTDTPDSNVLTVEEEAYIDAILDIASVYGEALNILGVQLSAAGADVSLMFDDDWKIEVVTALAFLLFAGDEVRSLEAPERFETLHEHWLNAAEHYDLVAELLAEGIDEFDTDKINRANEEMSAGQEDISLAIDEIERLSDEGVDFSSP